MKTKNTFRTRCITFALAITMCFIAIVLVSYADSDEHESCSSLLEGHNYEISYTMSGNDIIEKLVYYENGVTTIIRTVHPNDAMDIQVIDISGEITESTGDSNYNLFYEIYTDQEKIKNSSLAQMPSLTGNEITVSQYKHRYIGTSGTDTVYAKDLKLCSTIADVAAFLADKCTNTKAKVIADVASFVFDQVVQNMRSDCYKITLDSVTYEVWLTASNTYYIHCYHQTVKEYKSNGTLLSTKKDYYQAIGG